MKTAAFVAAFELVIFTKIILVSADEPIAHVPKLTLTWTDDVTFTCNMAAFTGRVGRVSALQILRDTSDQGRIVLATGDVTGARKSSHLKDTVAMVTGALPQKRVRNSWLSLKISNAGPREFGRHLCRVLYTEHRADVSASAWESEVITLGTNSSETERKPGFHITQSKGMDISCSVQRKLELTDVFSVKIFAEDINSLVADVSIDSQHASEKNRHFPENVFLNNTHAVVSAHMWSISCASERNYVCIAELQDNRLINSTTQHLHMHDCSSKHANLGTRTETVTVKANEGVLFMATCVEDVCDNTKIVIPVTTLLVLGFAGVALLIARQKLRYKLFRRTGSRRPAEDLMQFSTIAPCSSVIDLQETNIHSSDTSYSHAQGLLLSRQKSESASHLELPADMHQRLNVFDSVSMCESVVNIITTTDETDKLAPTTIETDECDRVSLSGRFPCTVEDDDNTMSYCV
ncbi:hypothetical protein BaRGS_00023038 [Batillaria attramentaria]|uniref:Ig-like domain-containing protein n=1 Tax=Batillaria attramentaria TaxID=370345 RepID=A0ABD0KFS2_9CAEN